MSDYAAFLARKSLMLPPAGLDDIPDIHPGLFPHQRDSVEFALRRGRSALFLDTGLGKSRAQSEWARIVAEHTGGDVLILAPLAVAAQTVREAVEIGVAITHCREPADVRPGINITNYDRLDRFDCSRFAGVVLDESSILKSFDGATKRLLVDRFRATPYRLACTATPAPNDHMELGNHAEFLGLMQANEMLQRWFINDTSTASQSWRLKGHAVEPFWDWVASWAFCVSRPSDLGYPDEGFALPELRLIREMVDTDLSVNTAGALFRMPEMSATSYHAEKRLTIAERAARIGALIAAEPHEPWLVWCDTDYEADAIRAAAPSLMEVRGSQTSDEKERRLVAFSTGGHLHLLTKPKIAGHGMNWQHCARVAFAGLSFSYEQFYQAVRRCWRFGQTRPVHVHICMAETELALWDVISRKQNDHDEMKSAMFEAVRRARRSTAKVRVAYNPTHKGALPRWLTAA